MKELWGSHVNHKSHHSKAAAAHCVVAATILAFPLPKMQD